MAVRRACVAVAVGIGLPLIGVAAPAQAAAPSTASTTQCQDLLSCVVPIVTGVTGTVATTVPQVLNGVPQIVGTVPKVVNSVPQVLSNLLGGKPPSSPTQGQKPPVTTPPQHQKPPVTTTHHPTTPPKVVTQPSAKPAPVVRATTPPVEQPVVIPLAPTHTNPVVQVIKDVGQVAAQVVTLFGWNLLALVPLAGIALVISRRMAAARRSASGLL